jgi:hypothetical protein
MPSSCNPHPILRARRAAAHRTANLTSLGNKAQTPAPILPPTSRANTAAATTTKKTKAQLLAENNVLRGVQTASQYSRKTKAELLAENYELRAAQTASQMPVASQIKLVFLPTS